MLVSDVTHGFFSFQLEVPQVNAIHRKTGTLPDQLHSHVLRLVSAQFTG